MHGGRLMQHRTCIECRSFDHATPRAEAATIVRCMDARNNGPAWPKMVAAAYPACRHFEAMEVRNAE